MNKTCPECGAEVPVKASRCKECFHDFNAEQRPSRAGPMALLAAVAAMAIIGAVTLGIIVLRPLGQDIIVDEETRSVVFTTHYRTGSKTDRLPWDDIASIEHLTKVNGNHEVVAVTIQGERRIIKFSAEAPLRSEAEHYAAVMEKPVVLVDNTRGFHKFHEGEVPPE